jgi:hypothetical protein
MRFFYTILLLSVAFFSGADDQKFNGDQNVVKFIVKNKVEIPLSIQKELGMRNPGIGSGLTFKGLDKDNNFLFYAVSDRGVNCEGPKLANGQNTRIFEDENFSPFISLVKVTGTTSNKLAETKAEVEEIIKLEASSLPISNTANEVILNRDLGELIFSPNGIDSESLDVDADGNFWVGDEYLPSIIKFSSTGEMLERYSSENGLPAMLTKRMENRGIESLAVTPNGKIVFLLETIVETNKENKKNIDFIRFVRFDPQTKELESFAYPLALEDYKSNSHIKLGDMATIDENRFLVIEQGKKKDGSMSNNIVLIDISNTTELTALDKKHEINTEEKAGINYKKISRKLLLRARDYGWAHDKMEGIAYINDKTIAVINDNDFAIESKMNNPQAEDPTKYTIDLKSGQILYQGKKSDAKIIYEDTGKDSEIWLIFFENSILN